MYVYVFTKQNQPWAVKKAKPSKVKIKRIVWHMRWMVRARADISLQPNGLVRPRANIYQVLGNYTGENKD